MTGLQEKLSNTKAGTKVKIVVKRSDNGEYKEKTLTITLGKKSESGSNSSSDSGNSNSSDSNSGNSNSFGNRNNNSNGNSGSNSYGNNGNSGNSFFGN